jgi:hypothetical protein
MREDSSSCIPDRYDSYLEEEEETTERKKE